MKHTSAKPRRVVDLILFIVLSAGACLARDVLITTSSTSQQIPASKCVIPSSADVRALEPGTVIGRELAGGPTHFYQINVSSGQFLRVLIDQKGIDIEASICTP